MKRDKIYAGSCMSKLRTKRLSKAGEEVAKWKHEKHGNVSIKLAYNPFKGNTIGTILCGV